MAFAGGAVCGAAVPKSQASHSTVRQTSANRKINNLIAVMRLVYIAQVWGGHSCPPPLNLDSYLAKKVMQMRSGDSSLFLLPLTSIKV